MKSKKRVLIVDDDAMCRAILQKTLTENGFEVLQSTNGLEALERLQTCRPDILILDIMMPRMSGYDLARHLKQEESTADIPIIFLSVKGSPSDMMKGYNESLVNYYIPKPICAKQLLSGIALMFETEVAEARPLVSEPPKKRRQQSLLSSLFAMRSTAQ